jgi:hypothetical protein
MTNPESSGMSSEETFFEQFYQHPTIQHTSPHSLQHNLITLPIKLHSTHITLQNFWLAQLSHIQIVD